MTRIAVVSLIYLVTLLSTVLSASLSSLRRSWKPSNRSMDDLYARMRCVGDFCYPELQSEMFEGDILLDEEQRNAISLTAYHWPHATIPYVFSSGVKNEDKQVILKAMKNLESRTCIKFVPKQFHHLQYIQIGTDKKGCYAMIGYRPYTVGASPVNLQSPECLWQVGTVEHELLHVIGLYHEQARADRDDHVDIYWDRIDPKYYSDFGKADAASTSTYNISYDYKSIMHYPRNAFSMDGRDTIVAKTDKSLDLGQRNAAAESDIAKVRFMYNCK